MIYSNLSPCERHEKQTPHEINRKQGATIGRAIQTTRPRHAPNMFDFPPQERNRQQEATTGRSIQTTGQRDAPDIYNFPPLASKHDNISQNDSGNDSLLVIRTPEYDAPSASHLSTMLRSSQLDQVHLLLSDKDIINKLSKFHGEYLVWYHGSYNTATFQEELHKFYSVDGGK